MVLHPSSKNSRWVNEYVLSLQEGNCTLPKERRLEISNIKVGDFAFVIHDNVPPVQWSLAKIQNVHTGPQKLVRVIKIKTDEGIYNRPVQKLKKKFDVYFYDDCI